MNETGLAVETTTLFLTTESEPRYALGVFAILCFTIGVPGNCIVLSYFVSKFKSGRAPSTIAYIFISGTDTLLCILIIFGGVSDFTRTPALFGSELVCGVWGIFWNATTRLSVFLVGILSLSRTLSFVFPLNRYFSKLSHFAVPIGTYTILQTLQSTVPFWVNQKYVYSGLYGICTYYLDSVYNYTSWQYKLIMFVIVDLEILIPFFTILISCGVSIYFLRRDMNSLHAGRGAETPNNKVHASITITVITCVYLVLNLPSCVVYIMYAISRFTNGSFEFWLYMPMEFEVFAAMHFIPINSTANLIVYIVRMKSLQRYIWRILLKAKYCLMLNFQQRPSLKLSRDFSAYSNHHFFMRDLCSRQCANGTSRHGSIAIFSEKGGTINTKF